MYLTTARLVLSDLTHDDSEGLLKILDNINVTQYTVPFPHPFTPEHADEFLGKYNGRGYPLTPRQDYVLGIRLKSRDKLLGIFGLLKHKEKPKVATIGFLLGERYWGRGFMTEAMIKIENVSFNIFALQKLEADVFVENSRSMRLLERFGFKKGEFMPQGAKALSTGQTHDVQVYYKLTPECPPIYPPATYFCGNRLHYPPPTS